MANTLNLYISYSAHDTAIMQRLRRDLGQYQFTIEASANEPALMAAGHVFVLLSPEAAYSQTVRSELALARQMRKRIVPILVRGEADEVTLLGFRPHQWVDLRDKDLYEHGLNHLLNLLAHDMGISLETLPTLYMDAIGRQALGEPASAEELAREQVAAIPPPAPIRGAYEPPPAPPPTPPQPKPLPVAWIAGAALLLLILIVAAVILLSSG